MSTEKKPLNVLALEPYYDGSHKAFLDGWIEHSRHHWTLKTLPGYKWKWRMRHAPITFARALQAAPPGPDAYDLIICSDMLNLAEFRGLAPQELTTLPTIVYFHENQFTYPVRLAKERDYHYAMTNVTTALAADQVWFNSEFHRESFLNAAAEFLKRMPDHAPIDALTDIRGRSFVHYPGVQRIHGKAQRKAGPCRVLWAARWEHDKNPDDFFLAVRHLRNQGHDFRISVIGQSFQDEPCCFSTARAEFTDIIDHWGYQATRALYWECLQEADIVVSTAQHEFFGIGMIEAMCAGAFPLLPKRLSYPEILSLEQTPSHRCFFYDGKTSSLAERLAELIQMSGIESLRQGAASIESLLQTYTWDNVGHAMDQALCRLPILPK